MAKREVGRHLLDILLLLGNSAGIAGALLQVLGVSWDAGRWRMFWGGVALFCTAAVFLRHFAARGRKPVWRAVWVLGLCAALYVLVGILVREQLFAGLAMALRDAIENVNERYQLHIALASRSSLLQNSKWMGSAGEHAGVLGILYVFFPLVLLMGCLWNRCRSLSLIVANSLWLAAACALNIFPDYPWLVLCILGAVAAVAHVNFRARPAAGLWALCWLLPLATLAVGVVYYLLLPGMDAKYEMAEEARTHFYMVVNEEWFPAMQAAIADWREIVLPGSGANVTGTLDRRNIFAYTAADVYRVTVDRLPQDTLYLKGFVGESYGEREWAAQSDLDLERYYREQGLKLPDKYADLVNISYEAAGGRQGQKAFRTIRIEELGGRSNYSIYPYGALLTDNDTVHGDGSVERKDRAYEFQYRCLADSSDRNALRGESADLERQYRQYVYDNFREYPEEALPLLTERLTMEKIRTGDVYSCALDIMNFLGRQARYDLDAGKNPEGTDFVEYFLFESHVGYCVHFASSAVLCLRYFGIPARYVAGYAASPSDFVRNSDGTYTAVIKSKQAHAWAEIYLDGIGWTPVEMTPGAAAFAADNRIEQMALVEELAGGRTSTPKNEDAQEAGLSVQGATSKPAAGEAGNSSASAVWQGAAESSVLQAGGAQGGISQGGMPQEGAEDLTGRIGRMPRRYQKVWEALLAAGVLWFAWRRLRGWQIRRWRGKLGRAGTREGICLLYRNLRRALQAAGCPRRLAVDEEPFWKALRRICPKMMREEYETFCAILEKNSFGPAEPSREEFLAVQGMHDKLVKWAGEKMPFYKKGLFMTAEGV